MLDNKEAVKCAKGQAGNHEEIEGGDNFAVVVEEGQLNASLSLHPSDHLVSPDNGKRWARRSRSRAGAVRRGCGARPEWDFPPSAFMRRIKRPICSITGPRSTSLRPNRQNSRNPARCQETTVSGWTMIKASDQRSHNRRSTIQNHRSSGSSLGRGCFRLTTASCCEEQQLPARVCGGAGRRHAGKRLLHRPRSPSSDLS